MAGFCRSLLRSAGYRTMVRLVSPKVGRDVDRGAAGMLGHLCGKGPQFSCRSLAAPLAEPVSLRAFSTEAGVPFNEEEYPPLPEYNSSRERKDKEVFIIFAKGLPWSCTAEDLLAFFSDCKIRDGVNGIHLMQKENGQPSGKAFIEMERKEDLQKALRKHRHYLGPRYVEVKEASDHDIEGLQAAPAQRSAQDGVVKLQGLPYSCTVEDVTQFFSGLDIVENGVKFVLDKRGRSSGIAFVEFASQEMADLALKRDREEIGNRYIEVFPSRKSVVPSQHSSWGAPSTTSASESAPPHDNWNASDSDTESPQAAPAQPPAQDGVVKLRGLPFSCTVEDVTQFFSGLDIVENGVTFALDKRGRSSGIAFVEFASQEMADLALKRDREEIGNRYIEVFPSQKSSITSCLGSRRTESPGFPADRSSESPHLHPPSSGRSAKDPASLQHRVHMRGLPFLATGQDVANFFSPLQPAKICMEYGGDGRASGEADVYFPCHEDAVSAMSRDKARMNDRYIELFLNSAAAQSKPDSADAASESDRSS
ncbi:heterogeneous nuclear ribonucleoprotein H2-like isoform X2 [Brienomyrus brachyistius]|uniref:heterogeneous nuclear ribonucleoprotein H2-like isoform X2 n=1 Tax=Brienomyrus brachyistius TaxID=42636 RepID=UPI0020B3021F|nr:heterogeneous nuclear ribonucleoprotein H2-like isoform X2 [Brienomyrus brachyistius]